MTRRDRLLEQMGITQWMVRNPAVLRGERGVRIPESTKLIIITDENLDLNSQLLKDIFFTMDIDETDMVCINSEQLKLIPTPITIPCWVLGNEIHPEGSKFTFISPVLSELIASSHAKQALWKQIYQYDENFNTKAI
ncbi:DNA polymerase III subunit psi [Providencia rustigianii]|uniref:DNA polymerase III subunit psi n=2 Tax=Providencia rustigianii TaxID=158850 RepID=D1P6I5_9GAMM|nr:MULTISPECIES: DNA polymerase III subunit psi [Providencia]EFB71027.1 putative DNA polymerase III, psi subunit [Providencia rustigianii DSM 4541]MTC58097.1 DNA polymerase III subunit psi [Providencia rustigianii]MTC61267.1 DNA polymerase III subunit psi [Providencia rustigianii]SPY76497.1 DNA polymerase III subunit psi [Providencia rustigianii]SUC25708.1 DNA polymerase III subunit psi [Providencia rustigianii]